MPTELLAGVSGADITPPAGVDLTGFGGRSGPSTSVHDDLAARVLFLAAGERRACVVSLDLIGLGRAESLALRSRIAAAAGVPANAVVLACSHTHSGPATHCLRFLGMPDEAYLAAMDDAVVACAGRAAATAVPVQIAWRRVAASVGVNRRQKGGGAVRLGIDEGGPVDSQATVLRVVTLGGTPLAHLFCHAAHAVTLGGDNLSISADWPGYARRAIERQTGGKALFLQGCCGNVNCRERNSFEAAEAQGEALAAAVLAAADAVSGSGLPLAVASEVVELPLLPPPTPARCGELLAEARAALAALPANANRGRRWMADAGVAWAESLARLPATPRSMPYEIQVVRLGDGALVALPGEVFVEYGQRIAVASPLRFAAVAAYASDCPSYIPTTAAYAEGGYEVENAIRYYGTTMPTPDLEERIVAAAARLLRAVGTAQA